MSQLLRKDLIEPYPILEHLLYGYTDTFPTEIQGDKFQGLVDLKFSGCQVPTESIATLPRREVHLGRRIGGLEKVSQLKNMGVSENSGTPKSSILIVFSIIHHPFWGTSIFGNTHIVFWCIHLQISQVYWSDP